MIADVNLNVYLEKISLNRHFSIEFFVDPYYNKSAAWKGEAIMLIKISVENFKSFDQKEELSLL